MRIWLFALVMYFAVTAPANAGVTHSDILEDVRSDVVEVQDAVKDECLPNPNSPQTKAGLILRSANILVVSEMHGESPASPRTAATGEDKIITELANEMRKARQN